MSEHKPRGMMLCEMLVDISGLESRNGQSLLACDLDADDHEYHHALYVVGDAQRGTEVRHVTWSNTCRHCHGPNP